MVGKRVRRQPAFCRQPAFDRRGYLRRAGPQGRSLWRLGLVVSRPPRYLDLVHSPATYSFPSGCNPVGWRTPRSQDKLVLEYKDFNGDWDEFAVIIKIVFGGGARGISPFRFFFPIPSLYKHGAFQFRLTNYNNRNGINNIWQVDYIRLSRFAADSAIADITFTARPGPSWALPQYAWRHFEGRKTMNCLRS